MHSEAEALEHVKKRDTGHQSVSLENKTGDSTVLKIRTVSRTLSVRNTTSAKKSGPSFARLAETLLGRMCARRHRSSRSRILPPTFCLVGVMTIWSRSSWLRRRRRS
ncbi:hypothetical protein GmHk_02G005105 [Glycine max]|nr:hypothetical protein GmHk_02G005105 [Glycine max]KAH1262498.1 hypothetical protein GmHk_02G005105 [Glycine max]